MRRDKFVKPITKVLDAKVGLILAVVSTEDEDRDGDIIRAEPWRLDNFLKHPVLIESHDYRDIRSQIGRWESMEVKGKRLEGVAKYYVGEGNEKADWAFNLASKGDAAYSVGFIPDMDKAKERSGGRGFEFNGQELLEVSHVSVPSNPRALQALKGFLEETDGDPIILEVIEAQLAKSVHGEHDHESNGSHTHDDEKGVPFASSADLAHSGQPIDELLADFEYYSQINETEFRAAIRDAFKEGLWC